MSVKNTFKKEKYQFDDLREIIKILRQPNGCPWDAEQTHLSIRSDLLEEAYEVADAIDQNDNQALLEELGDLLLQVVFHSQIATEENSFSFDDVVDGICKKLVLRHPHVFGDVVANTSDEVLNNWDKIKRNEKNQKTFTDTLVSVPKAFPSLMRAAKVQKRASKAGFDWNNTEDVISKLLEEVNEFVEALHEENAQHQYDEFGDILFSIVNISRFYNIDAENSLAKATDKFIRRFKSVEEEVISRGCNMQEMSLEEMDDIWEHVKSKEK